MTKSDDCLQENDCGHLENDSSDQKESSFQIRHLGCWNARQTVTKSGYSGSCHDHYVVVNELRDGSYLSEAQCPDPPHAERSQLDHRALRRKVMCQQYGG